jgi:hypothetical protein
VSHARLLPVAVVTLSCALVAATPGATAKPRPIPANAAFSLPSASHCVSGRKLTLKVKKVRHIHWLSATIKINGHTVKTVKGKKLAKPIRLTGLPKTKFTLKITAKARGDRQADAHRTYKPCGGPSSTPTPTPTPTPPATSPGSFSGSTSQSRNVSFYVAADKAHVQDVSIQVVTMSCAPTKGFDDHLQIASIAINPDGSFSSTTTQDGVLDGAAAHFTYTFAGQLTGNNATGSFREDIAYDNGIAYSCTSNPQTWNASRDAQGSQAATPPPPGTYSGATSQARNVSFYVAADSAHLEDVSIPVVTMGCAPTRGFDDQLSIASVAINPDGSFTATTTQDGVIASVPAHFTYTFTGHFHGTASNGTERVGGQFREDITYDDGTARTCSSDVQTWNTTRDTQGSQTTTPPLPGSYSGTTSQARNVSFFVSNDKAHLQDVSIPVVTIACTPSKPFDDQVQIASIVLNGDGSFSSTTTQDGVFFGAPAHFTYTFSGHLHGLASDGTQRVAGRVREDVTFDNGTAYSCTSNDQTWTATRTAQGTQSAAAPPPGTYGGTTAQSRSVTFHVANSASMMTNVDIPVTTVGCTPSKGFDDQLVIGSITIGSDGSFSSTTSADGVVSGGAVAHFTYTFRGHFHGTTSAGAERAAGQFREDITFDNGTAYSCTTNDLWWSATRTGP